MRAIFRSLDPRLTLLAGQQPLDGLQKSLFQFLFLQAKSLLIIPRAIEEFVR